MKLSSSYIRTRFKFFTSPSVTSFLRGAHGAPPPEKNPGSAPAEHGRLIRVELKIKTKSKSFSPESGKRKKLNMQRLSLRFSLQQFFTSKICGDTFFTQIYRDLYADPMLEPIRMDTNMSAEFGNQQKHWSLSFAAKKVDFSLDELKNIKIIIFLIHELFRWPNFPK